MDGGGGPLRRLPQGPLPGPLGRQDPGGGVGRGKDREANLKAWARRYLGNEEEASSLLKALKCPEGVNPVTPVVETLWASPEGEEALPLR